MKFKEFQALVLFSSTFKALNLGEKIQVLSKTFKDAWEPWNRRGVGERGDQGVCGNQRTAKNILWTV